ncbi:hypothetical protein Zmor_014583 [Zophobas morio]|uniref:Uncharacterized protein n=1 Tax=Zophobas morio TaxID=2755281 RepID=A0AA38IK59_9CUCU|nr:hypothetical protein Zmor_014583 [Zophobas morio]
MDCYGNPEKSGKKGTDIQEGKCTWLAVMAMEKGTHSQMEIMKECYGRKDPKAVATVLNEGLKAKLNKIMIRKLIALVVVHILFIQPLFFKCVNDKLVLLRQAIISYNVSINETTNEIQKMERTFQLIDCKDKIKDLDDYGTTKLLWLLGMCPLIVNEHQTSYEAISLCNEEKFILIGSGTKEEHSLSRTVFQNLSDLDLNSMIYKDITRTFNCLLQGKQEVSLEFLIEPNENIRTVAIINDLVKMLDGPYPLGEQKEVIPKPYISRLLSVKHIDIKYFKNVNKDTLLVIDCTDKFDKIKNKIGNFNLIDISLFLRDDVKNSKSPKYASSYKPLYYTSPCIKNFASGSDVYISEKCSHEDFVKICRRNSGIERSHHLKIVDEMTLEWIRILCTRLEQTQLDFREQELVKQSLPNHRTLFHTSPYLKNYVPGSDIYISDECSLDDFQKICNHNPKIKKFHHLKIIDEKTLEWVRSKGDISDLSRYRREEIFVEETTLYTSELDNNVNVVNGDPGTGKSELLKNIKNSCGVDFWCIFFKSVDTTLLCTRLEKIQADQRESELIEFIRDTMYVGYPNFDKELIKLLIKNHHVVYFWDALDEVTTKCIEIVIDLIKELSQKSVFQWITSRCHLKKQLEKKFGVLSRNVRQFSEKEQTRYIHQRLKDFYSDEYISKVIQQIRTTVTSIKHNNILAIPLQIYMFTELFYHDPVKYSDLLEKLFSLTDLYQNIIDEKFNRYYKEKADVRCPNSVLRKILESYKRTMFEKYEKAGLKSLVKKEVFKQLNINCDDFLNEIQDGADSIGLIIEVTDKFPQFLHNSYAEFFVAKYFMENHKEINDFEKIIFDSRYTNVRFFYDLLTAKDSGAHKAVLYRNTDLLKKQQMNDMFTCEDTRGRNVLEVACSWGQRLPILQVEKNDNIYIINNEKDDSLCEESTEYTEMLKYLLENCHTNGDQQLKNAALESAKKSESLLAKLILLVHSSSKLRNDDDSISILYYSAKFGYTQAIDLFDNVPYVKTKKYGFSLLHLSVNYGQEKYVEKLLSIEAYRQNIDDKDGNGETPLYKACQYGYYEPVVYLVNHGANVNATTSNGSSPLHTACLHLHTNIVRLLLSSKAHINAVKKFNITPLHVACWNGHYDVVDLLLQKGANINAATSDGCTPLYVASRNRHDTVVKLLLQKNVDINLAQEDDVTPLFIACQEGHKKNVDLLLEAGADVNLVTKSGESPLYAACQNGHEAVVKLLIKFGAKLNAVADNGFMPIHIASQQGFSNVVQLLLEQGVDANVRSSDGMTALSIARNLGHDEVVSLLKRS